MTASAPVHHFSAAPYPGLRPFLQTEADIFFGREEQVDQLLKKLQNSHFLAVVGPSGCGKSSLVRAGMITALRAGFLTEAGARWRVAEMRPGERPLARLAESLVAPSALGTERGQDPDAAAFLLATLRRGPLGLLEALRETPLPEHVNLLLLVDQFEELFRFREEGNAEEADAFVALLLATAAQSQVPIYIVLTMRTDYLGRCALFSGLPEAMSESQFLTPRMTRAQSEAAIVKPARNFDGRIDPALVNRLLNDLGTDPNQLPLLQHCLMRMWAQATNEQKAAKPHSGEDATSDAGQTAALTITLEHYNQVGGLNKALSDHADEVLKRSLDAEQQRIAQVMFRRLTERSDAQRDTRRPSRLDDVASVAGVDWTEVATVVEVFRQPERSFIMPPEGVTLEPETRLDISHESLISLWQTLNEWVVEESRAAADYERLKKDARLWKFDGYDLLGENNLRKALEWKSTQTPTAAWARRYGSAEDYALTMEFLNNSEAAWAERHRLEAARLERERRSEIESRSQQLLINEQARKKKVYRALSAALALLGLVAVVAASSALQQFNVAHAQSQEAARQSIFASENALEATREKDKAEDNAREVTKQRQLAEKAAADAITQQERAVAQQKLAVANAALAKKNERKAVEEAAEAARQKKIAEAALVDLGEEKKKTDDALAATGQALREKNDAFERMQEALRLTEEHKISLQKEKRVTETALEDLKKTHEALKEEQQKTNDALAALTNEKELTTALKSVLPPENTGDSTSTPDSEKPKLRLQLKDVYGNPLKIPVQVALTNTLTGKKLNLNAQASNEYLIENLALPYSVYRIAVASDLHQAETKFVTIRPKKVTDVALVMSVDTSKVTRVEFPSYGSLPEAARQMLTNSKNVVNYEGQSGEALYRALDNMRRANLLNIIAKAQSMTFPNQQNVLQSIQEIREIRGDRLFALVQKPLRGTIRDSIESGLFKRVSSVLHKPPPQFAKFDNDGSFKSLDTKGSLQITFFEDEGIYLAEIEIDDTAGTLNHPYNVHQILVGSQKIDPGYRFLN